jgi:pimeloyl-ACP methyl ester carboxylesterase
VLGGIYDPGFASSSIARRMRKSTPDDTQVIAVGYPGFSSFERCAAKAVEALERRFPSESDSDTIEVDVIGYSMGGIVARYAAMPAEGGRKRLKIRRLFTVASPHRGARLAALPIFFDPRVAAMRSESEFMAALNKSLAAKPFELVCYARLGDLTVGARNTAPDGMNPYWVPNTFPSMGHYSAAFDKRIMLQ